MIRPELRYCPVSLILNLLNLSRFLSHIMVTLSDRKLPLRAGGLRIFHVLQPSFLKDKEAGQQDAMDPS